MKKEKVIVRATLIVVKLRLQWTMLKKSLNMNNKKIFVLLLLIKNNNRKFVKFSIKKNYFQLMVLFII
jgi:hypothetical protein